MSYDSYINTWRGIPFSVHAGIKTKIDKTSHLPTLTTWHCSHSSAACRCCRIDRYLLPTAANRHQRVCCCWPMLGQTSYRFMDPVPHTMRAVPVTHGGRWNFCITLMATTMMSYYTGWAKKPDCFSDLITLWRLVLERRAVFQNFQNFIEKKVQNWHFNEFKYSLPNLLKSSQQLKLWYIWPEHMDFTQFTLTYSETTVIFPQS